MNASGTEINDPEQAKEYGLSSIYPVKENQIASGVERGKDPKSAPNPVPSRTEDYSRLDVFFPNVLPAVKPTPEKCPMMEAEDYLGLPRTPLVEMNHHPKYTFSLKDHRMGPSTISSNGQHITTHSNDTILLLTVLDATWTSLDRRAVEDIGLYHYSYSSPYFQFVSTGDVVFVVDTGRSAIEFYCSRTTEQIQRILYRVDDDIVWVDMGNGGIDHRDWMNSNMGVNRWGCTEGWIKGKDTGRRQAKIECIGRPDFLVMMINHLLIVVHIVWTGGTGMKATTYIGKWTEKSDEKNAIWWIDEENNIVIIDKSREVFQIAIDDVMKFKDTKTMVNVKRLDRSYLDRTIKTFSDDVFSKEHSTCVVGNGQTIIQLKDRDVYEVSRPEGENVLKIRRFRATVGSLTLEGEYSILLNSSASKSKRFHVFPYRKKLLIVLDDLLRVYSLSDNTAHLIVERNIMNYKYVKPLYCGKLGFLSEAPDKTIEYTVVSTGYIDTDTDYRDGYRLDNSRIDSGDNKNEDRAESMEVCSNDGYQWDIKYIIRGSDNNVRYLTRITKYNEQEISQWPLDNVPFDYKNDKSVKGGQISYFINREELLIYYTLKIDPPMHVRYAYSEDDSPQSELQSLILSRVCIDLHTGQRTTQDIDITERYKSFFKTHTNVDIAITSYEYSVIIEIRDIPSRTVYRDLLILQMDHGGMLMVIDADRECCGEGVASEYCCDGGIVWKRCRDSGDKETIGNVAISCRDVVSGKEVKFENPLIGEKEVKGQKKGNSSSSDIVRCYSALKGKIYFICDSLNRCVIYSIESSTPKSTLYDKFPSDAKEIILSPDGLFFTYVTPSTQHKGINSLSILTLSTGLTTTLDLSPHLPPINAKERDDGSIPLYVPASISLVYYCPLQRRCIYPRRYYVLTCRESRLACAGGKSEGWIDGDRDYACVVNEDMNRVLMTIPVDRERNSRRNPVYHFDLRNMVVGRIHELTSGIRYFDVHNPNCNIIYMANQNIQRYKSAVQQSILNIDEKNMNIDEIIECLKDRPLIEYKDRLKHVIYTLYLVNDSRLFALVLKKLVNYADLFKHFDLITLITAIPNGKSILALKSIMEEDPSRKFIKDIADNTIIIDAILTNAKSIISSDECKTLLTFLLFMPNGHNIDGELRNEYNTVTFIQDGMNSRDAVKQDILKKSPETISTFSIFESGFDLDLSKGSQFSSAFFKIIRSMHPEVLVQKYRGIVYFKWTFYFWAVLYHCILYWTNFILSYIYFGYHPTSIGLLIVILICSTLLLLFEFKCMFSVNMTASPNKEFSPSAPAQTPTLTVTQIEKSKEGKSHEKVKPKEKVKVRFSRAQVFEYIRNPSNFYDLASLCFTILAALIVYNKDAYQLANQPHLVWLRMIPVVLLGGRSITWLRVFTPTRYLITSVLSVFGAMVPFLTILSFFILVFSFMWRLTDGLTGSNYPGEEATFYQSLTSTLNIIFGNTADPFDSPTGEYTTVKFIIWILGNVLLSLTLLNFLIAVLSGVFEATTVERSLHDLYELIVIMEDFDLFFSGLNCLASKHRRVHLAMLLPPDNTGDSSVTVDVLKDNNYSLEIILEEQIEKKIKKLEVKIEKDNDEIKSTMKSLQDEMKEFKAILQSALGATKL